MPFPQPRPILYGNCKRPAAWPARYGLAIFGLGLSALFILPASAADIVYPGNGVISEEPSSSNPALWPGPSSLTGNNVIVNSGTITGNVFGGSAPNLNIPPVHDATNNHVIINGGVITGPGMGNVYGAYAGYVGVVTGNSVTINGGAVDGDVYGGQGQNGFVGDNHVLITGGTINGSVYGSNGGHNSTGNSVTISGGTINGSVYGAYAAGGDSFTGNTLYKNSATLLSLARNFEFIFFGYSGDAGIAGLDVAQQGVVGSQPLVKLDTGGNDITISGVIHDGTGTGGIEKVGAGTLTLTGANTYKAGTTVSEGTLSIGNDNNIGTGTNTMAGGTLQLTGATYSKGWTLGVGSNAIETAGNTTLNGVLSGTGGFAKTGAGTLTLSGNNTYSGLTEARGGVLALSGAGSISDTLALYGGTTFNTGGTNVNLNRLDVRGAANWTGNLNMAGQTMNFYVPAAMGNGQTMLAVSGTADVAGSTVTINGGIDGARPLLKVGDAFILIDATNALNGTPANTMNNGVVKHGATLKYDFAIVTANNQLLADITQISAVEQAKALSEGFLSGMALVTQGADHVAGAGMANAVSAAKGAGRGGYGLAGFGSLSGGHLRLNTGSHVVMSSVSLLAGLARGQDLDFGRTTLGAFLEFGNGSYDTYNSFSNAASVSGDGSACYLGGGLLGHLDFTDTGPGNFYTEASFRAGGLYNDYHNSDLRDSQGRRAEYDSSSAYYGFHIGPGYIWNLRDKASLDLYGKYFWTRQEGDSVRLSTGDPVRFKDVDSSRLRFGGRFAYAVNEHVSPYIGAAYEHEFDGQARATSYGYSIDAPKLEGGTGISELGLTWKPSKDLPLSFDLGLSGYVGKREGVTGSLQIRFEF